MGQRRKISLELLLTNISSLFITFMKKLIFFYSIYDSPISTVCYVNFDINFSIFQTALHNFQLHPPPNSSEIGFHYLSSYGDDDELPSFSVRSTIAFFEDIDVGSTFWVQFRLIINICFIYVNLKCYLVI